VTHVPAGTATVVKPPVKVTPTVRVTTPTRANPAPGNVGSTDEPAPVPTETPTLNVAPESETLTLAGTSTPTTPIPAAVVPQDPDTEVPASAPETDADGSRAIDLASNNATTLGLSDNLLLAALVAVFALAVIALVSAGGHRGSWRRH
jgi:hypothetical protein